MASRILHIMLALLVWISTTGFTANFHYCKGELKSFAFVVLPENCHETDACHIEKAVKSCCAKSAKACEQPEGNDNCCDNETEWLQLETDFTGDYFSWETPDVEWMPISITKPFQVETAIFSTIVPFEFYRPPPLVMKIFIRVQSFLC